MIVSLILLSSGRQHGLNPIIKQVVVVGNRRVWNLRLERGPGMAGRHPVLASGISITYEAYKQLKGKANPGLSWALDFFRRYQQWELKNFKKSTKLVLIDLECPCGPLL